MANPEEALLLEDLPFSLDAEQAVLGGMLIDPDCIPVVLEQLSTPQMFYRKQHAGLFEVFLNMSNLTRRLILSPCWMRCSVPACLQMQRKRRCTWRS